LTDLLEIVTTLQRRKVAFASLKEELDTSNAADGRYFTFFASLAEFERELIRERTRAGLAATKGSWTAGGTQAEAR
jgi:DNA invertase Pin-like site-specific DNA recombinase